MTTLDYNSIQISRELLTRIFSRLTVQDMGYKTNCWIYTTPNGVQPTRYASIRIGKSMYVLHRVTFVIFMHPIDPILDCDHLCRVRGCCNPSHIEPVTTRENILRGQSDSALNASKTHCQNGHPFTADNLVTLKRKGRICKTCHREYETARRRAKGRKPRRDTSISCVNGHLYTPETIYIAPRGTKGCRICLREQHRQWKQRQCT